MFSRWHGPAVVLGQQLDGQREEGSQSYWIAHGGNLLLVAAQHLRAATREEALSGAVMNQTLGEMQGQLEQQRHQLRFRDLLREHAHLEEVPADTVMESMIPPPTGDVTPPRRPRREAEPAA